MLIIDKASSTSVTKPKQVTTPVVEKKAPIVVKKGQIVTHKSFGEGTVISSGEYIKIIFPKHGEKTFTNPGAFEMGFLKL